MYRAVNWRIFFMKILLEFFDSNPLMPIIKLRFRHLHPLKNDRIASFTFWLMALSFYSEFLMIFFRIMFFLRLTNRFTTIRNIISYEKLFS